MKDNTFFFQVGGTLSANASCYIERPADRDLVENISHGELCMILAPRQTGKSSLMIHTISYLREEGINTGIVDLQPLGSHKEQDAWFQDMVYQIERSLNLSIDSVEWWEKHQRLGATQRFITFMEDIVLTELTGKVIIFFDEIDSVLSLPFSDDFFTTIRSLYNARANNTVLRRLGFVFLGVATPSEFIKNKSRTPFNIGKEIQLSDFDSSSLKPFETILGKDSESIINRIFYWTAGQPLMIQKLTETIYNCSKSEQTQEKVDAIVKEIYLDTRIEKDTHLKFIGSYLLKDKRTADKVLKTYGNILTGKQVTYDAQSNVHANLILSGVVRVDNGILVLRNRIYPLIFNHLWIRKNKPSNVIKTLIYSFSSLLFFLLLWILVLDPFIFSKFYRNQRMQAFLEQFVFCEGGTFVMGDSPFVPGGPNSDESSYKRLLHEVTLSDFWISKYEITNQQYCDFLNSLHKSKVKEKKWIDLANPFCQIKKDSIGRFYVNRDSDDLPVVCVSWFGAVAFAESFSAQLPTEAQWEYASRGGNKSRGYVYSGGNILDSVAWNVNNSNDHVHKVGEREPNELGLYDMSGNVNEWCHDRYGEEYYLQCMEHGIVEDPFGPDSGSERVSRGCAYQTENKSCRYSARFFHPPENRLKYVGFRLIRSQKSGK